jgi:hypothetical protein
MLSFALSPNIGGLGEGRKERKEERKEEERRLKQNRWMEEGTGSIFQDP